MYMYVHMYLHVHVPKYSILKSARLSSFFNSRGLRSGGVSFELRVMNGEERSVVRAVLERVDEGDQRLNGIGANGRGSPHDNEGL